MAGKGAGPAGILPGTALGEIWPRLARPFDPVAVVEAALGFSHAVARQYVGAVTATSDEAEDLLDRFPRIVRSLAVTTTATPERCHGEIRGPVLWGETMGARSASAGDPGLFVCARPEKAYDTLENQVLVAALRRIRSAARDAESMDSLDYDDELLRRARHNGHRAHAALEHRALLAVSKARLTGRALRRSRSGPRRRVYGPAAAMVERGDAPVTLDHLAGLVDRGTERLHDLFVRVLHALEASGARVPPVRPDHGDLYAGPVRMRHPMLASENRPGGVLLLDVPVSADADLPGLVSSLAVDPGG